jgi:tRNA(fMet)-specific endonuclease VapC
MNLRRPSDPLSPKVVSLARSWTDAVLLDTSFLIDLIDGHQGAVQLAEEIDRSPDVPRLPTVVLFELWYGATRSRSSEEEKSKIEELTQAYDLAAFEATDAKAAAELLDSLSRKGSALSTIDCLVAGMAVSRSETLVTGDPKLARILAGLRVRTYE